MEPISNDLKQQLETSTSLKTKNKIVVGTTVYDGSKIKTYPKIAHKNNAVYGGFPAKTCSFELYDANNNIDLENKEIKVYKGIEVNNEIEWILQGIFIPQAKDIKTNINSKSILFNNVQDKTQYFDVSYNSDLVWENNTTHTGLEIIKEICDKLSIELSSSSFNLSTYDFNQPNFSENATCREVINKYAEIAGSIAFINRQGKLEIKAPTATNCSFERNRYIKLTKEKVVTFNTLVLGKEGLNDDIVYPATLGDERVEYKILDNPFVDLYREDMIEDISANFIGKSYIPFTLNNFVDGFCLDLNDIISVKDRNGNTLKLTILNYEIASRISVNTSAETVDSNKTDYNLAGSNKSEINKVKLDVDHNRKKITALAKSTDENTEKIAQVVIENNQIKNTVSQNYQETNNNITETNKQLTQIKEDISGVNINVSNLTTKTQEIDGNIEKIEQKLDDMSYDFTTAGLKVGKSTDDNNTVLDNNGIRSYNKTELNAIFNKNGSGVDKLIVTGTAQIGYLKIKKTIRNGKKRTSIYHLEELIENLTDLEG